ncbi:MAG: sigma-70 family RNA polymerase sigma factor [Myxococcales bacterium]|nr:sigma-70 family RNA polymerase sigma factor [Myxococcales bacterium]
MDPDLALLLRWRDGDGAAGEALFARHLPSLARFFTTKCPADADDLVQRTLLGCVQARDQFRAESTFRTYLFTVARNELYHHLQRARRDATRLDFSVTSVADLVTTPATRLARSDDNRRVLAAMRELSVEQQTLLELCYWEGLDGPALAEVFGITAGAVRVRLHRAREALRDRLGVGAPDEVLAQAGAAAADRP